MRRLQIQSPTGRDQTYRAFVSEETQVGLFAGVSGCIDEEGHPIQDIAGQARRAAELLGGLIRQAALPCDPQIVLRVLASRSPLYAANLDEVSDAIRDGVGYEASVNVTLVPQLMNRGAMLELDGVLAV